jgi:hypothetical protein
MGGDGNDKQFGVDIGIMMTYLSLANRRDADEGNRNIIRNPPIQSELEQEYLREMMIILDEMLRILGLQVMDSNLGRARVPKCRHRRKARKSRCKQKQARAIKKTANVERPVQIEHDPTENRVHTSACAKHNECHHVLT